MNLTAKVIEVAQNLTGYRYQLQIQPSAGSQTNGALNIVSATPIAAYVLGASITVMVSETAA